MATSANFSSDSGRPKSFWKRPEGITGAIFLITIVGGLGFLLLSNAALIGTIVSNTLYLTLALLVLGVLLYMILDRRTRNLFWYMYKSVMRWITGLFVTIDPIGILKNYVDDLEKNLNKLREQIGAIRGQQRKLQTIVDDNSKEIESNMKLAQAARDAGKEQQMLLASRKAARLKESNDKYLQLLSKMDVLQKILSRMHNNSEILLEDTKDQVKLKEQERKAIRTSHSAMKSAMSVIQGDPDKRAMFDAAMENIADDVANKVGEMEQFMEMSANFMESIDLQNGMFEEQGLKMLEEWEKKSSLMLMDGTQGLDSLDLNQERPQRQAGESSSSYDNLFGGN